MKTLSLEQEAAVASTAQTTYVAAGPGAGKSRVIIARVARLVATGVDPKRITILTFTNAGAHVFKERLAALGITVGFAGTLHAFCLSRLIQAHGAAIGYQAGRVSLIAEEERDEMLEEVRRKLAPKLKKTALNPRSGTILSAQEEFDAALVLKAFARKLKLSGCIDYDGVLEVGLELLTIPGVRAALDIAELLTDETQDSGGADWDVFDALPAESRFMVSDPDQSCYAFRGARPDLFTARANAPGATTYTLQTNYRSGHAICDAANNLIRHNGGRVEKWCLATDDAPESRVRHIHLANEAEEVNYIAGVLKSEHSERIEGNIPWNEMAVLARTNALVKGLRQKLREAGIPIKEPVCAEMPHDWHLCMALIAGLYSPTNPIVIERLLKAMGKEPAQIATWRREAEASGMTLCAVAGILQFVPPNMETLPAALVMHHVSPASVAIVRTRMAVLPQEDATLGDLLQDLWVHESWSAEEEGEGVHVGTFHSFKGREAECVILAGCEESEWGGRDQEELRRLFFVGITRARRYLYLTSAATRWKYGKPEQSEPAKFIEEMML